MSSILEIEETLTEIHELPTYEKSLQTPQRLGFINRLAATLKGMAVRSERSTEFGGCQAAYETPVDILARKYPYEYVQALVG